MSEKTSGGVYAANNKNADAAAPAGTKRRSGKKKLLITAAASVFMLAASYAAGAFYFTDHLLPNTYVCGEKCSLMTTGEVSSMLVDRAKEKTFTVSFRESDDLSIKGSEIGLFYADADFSERLMSSQDVMKWPASFFTKSENDIVETFSINKDRLRNVLNEVPPMQEENMTPPRDAYIDYSEKDKRFVIVPETEGTVINTEQAADIVFSSISSGRKSVDLDEENGVYAEPEIRSSSESLKEKADELNTAILGSITYDLPDGETVVLDADTMSGWIGSDDDGYYIDEDKWYDEAVVFVDEIAKKTNSVWETREFDSTDDGTVDVPGGTYGYIVDKDAEIDAIVDMIHNDEDEERAPYYTSEESEDRSNHGFGGTYVEVSISGQHLWYYEDGDLVMDCSVVTGTSGRTDTPRGQFRVQFTQRNAVLLGRPDANGNPSYRTPVSYWMPFYDGCGLHDANWRGSFGGNIYKSNGSHGCVNMPPAAAAELFDHIEGTNTIVIVY